MDGFASITYLSFLKRTGMSGYVGGGWVREGRFSILFFDKSSMQAYGLAVMVMRVVVDFGFG